MRAALRSSFHSWKAHSVEEKRAFVAGTRQLAARVAVYGKDHPVPFFDWDAAACPWVDAEKMRREGAVFVWDADEFGDQLPLSVLKAYPKLHASTIVELQWHSGASLKPVRVGLALLPIASH